MDVLFRNPAPVTFDFAKYGIPLYADEEDVYLPLELLSTMFTDVACNYVLWNGESVLKPVMDIGEISLMPLGWYESRYMRALLTGKSRRKEDVIREDYAELCFTLDHFFGHPGTGILDRGIGEKGLDAALDDVPELASLKDRLKDPDMIEYMLALYDLFNIGLNDGHCSYSGKRVLPPGGTTSTGNAGVPLLSGSMHSRVTMRAGKHTTPERERSPWTPSALPGPA